MYPEYLEKQLLIKKKIRIRAMWFIVFLAISILVFTNFMIKRDILWSLITSGPIVYIAITIRYTFFSSVQVGLKILIQTVFLSLLLILLDLATGFSRWSVNYVIPFIVIMGTLLIQILFFSKKVYWQDFIGYLLILLMLCVVPLLLFFAQVASVLWPSSIAAFFSTITFIFMLFFFKKFKSEVKQRLYL